MFRKLLSVTGGMALAATALLADFSYQETSKITGGAVVNMMQFAGTFSKNARQAMEPQQSSVAIKGDRMVHRNDKMATIIDVNAETITHIDMEKKQYSVMTFAQLKQALDDMAKKMKQQNGDGQQMNYKLSVDNTGKTRQIAGLDCKELIMKMEMEGTDAKSGQTGSMIVNIDTWVAGGVPGYDEARNFYKKMAEKIAWAPGSNAFMAQPGIMQGMAAAQKELAKLDGVPVLRVMNMGAEGTVPPQAPAEGDSSAQKQQQPQQDKPSVSGALGSALGGRFGLGRKKPKDDSAAPAANNSSSGGSASGVLVEMTMESTGFSKAPVDDALFQVPAGFKQVEAELGKSRR